MFIQIYQPALQVRRMAIRPHKRRLILPALRYLSISALLLGMPAIGRAKNNCPWINEATASGLLGGDAVGEFAAPSGGQPAVCTFTRSDAIVTHTLRIAVLVASDFDAGYTSALKECGPDSAAIQAIGNQAVICSADDRKGPLGERVVGRVRDQIFTITISSNLKGDPVFTRQVLKTRIYTAAEQVAGNLF